MSAEARALVEKSMGRLAQMNAHLDKQGKELAAMNAETRGSDRYRELVSDYVKNCSQIRATLTELLGDLSQ